MSAPACRLENIRQEYSGKTVLDVESLEVGAGSVLGLAGPNGSGKSTLLRIMALLESPAAGQVFFQGRPVTVRLSTARRVVTLLNQEPYLLKRTVAANVAYGLKVRGESGVSDRVDEALAMVGLDPADFSRRFWYELSGGEAQRVALAARLALEPGILLMDEPTSSLDEESTELIKSAALAARDRGVSLVVASHDMEWLNAVSDQVIRLRKGIIERNSNQ